MTSGSKRAEPPTAAILLAQPTDAGELHFGPTKMLVGHV
jgi:hypothetical protein